MDKFGSFFEFIAALNSAYIVSNHFIESLVSKISRDFRFLEKRLDDIESRQKKNEDYLIEEGPKCHKSAFNFLKELNDKNIKISEDITAHKDELNLNIKRNSISESFNFLCLFGALYSILILILNGFEFSFDTPYTRESFLIFNLLCILFLGFLFLNKNPKYFPTYTKIILGFLITTLVFPVFYFIEKNYSSVDCFYDFRYLNIILALIVPTSHFIYYFIISLRKSKKSANKIKIKVDEIESNVNSFATEIRTSLSAIGKLEIRDEI